jgi:hypothetical protein
MHSRLPPDQQPATPNEKVETVLPQAREAQHPITNVDDVDFALRHGATVDVFNQNF